MNKIIITILLFLNITHYSFQYICDEKFQEFLTELKPVIDSFRENDDIKALLFQFLESDPKYEELMTEEISSLMEKLIDIYYKNPNDTIRQKAFAEEILKLCLPKPINIPSKPRKNLFSSSIPSNNGDSTSNSSYNDFCIFIVELFGLKEDTCEEN